MIDGGVEIMNLPTISGFLERLKAHAGKEAPLGQWGFYPGAKGRVLENKMVHNVPGAEIWIGRIVYDGNGLVEDYIGQYLEGSHAERMKFQYDEWCYGHIGEDIEEMVELPGTAVFRVSEDGYFEDVGYLYEKVGDGLKDWMIFTCSNLQNGLSLQKMDDSWNRWGLISMVMRYDLKGPMTCNLQPLRKGTPYAVVGSSVLNFRKGPKEKLITSLPNGTIVELTGKVYGDWTEVMVGDKKGVVFSKFLEKHPEG